eukprot:3867044-Rhodomonas_salina.2
MQFTLLHVLIRLLFGRSQLRLFCLSQVFRSQSQHCSLTSHWRHSSSSALAKATSNRDSAQSTIVRLIMVMARGCVWGCDDGRAGFLTVLTVCGLVPAISAYAYPGA